MIIIDNNFLDKKEIEYFQDIMINKSHLSLFPWYLNLSTNIVKDATIVNNLNNDTIQFVHGAYANDIKLSPLADNAINILNKFSIKNNIIIDKILRIKANLLLRGNSLNPHTAHIDMQMPHFVFLYYVNDSDGDTVIFKEKYNGKEIINLTEEKRVKPAAGTAIVFDGLQYHASSSPLKSELRSVINIDFFGKIND
jgi:hypothetical protein